MGTLRAVQKTGVAKLLCGTKELRKLAALKSVSYPCVAVVMLNV